MGTRKMKTNVFLLLAMVVITGVASPSYADDFNPPIGASGYIVSVYADSSDFVVEIDTPGICTSGFFNIQRDQTNFKELTAMILAAFSAHKKLYLFIKSCSNGRNIVSHGGAFE
jgi:hypothetical protein